MRSHPTTTVIVRPVGLTNGPACRHVIGRTVDQDVGPLVSRQDVARLMVSLVEDDRWDDQAVTVGPARGAHA